VKEAEASLPDIRAPFLQAGGRRRAPFLQAGGTRRAPFLQAGGRRHVKCMQHVKSRSGCCQTGLPQPRALDVLPLMPPKDSHTMISSPKVRPRPATSLTAAAAARRPRPRLPLPISSSSSSSPSASSPAAAAAAAAWRAIVTALGGLPLRLDPVGSGWRTSSSSASAARPWSCNQ
jgi:hypothetical protein